MDHAIALYRLRKRLAFAALSLLALLAMLPAHAETLILAAPPRENAQAGQALYGPLAAGLSKLWGVDVKYQHPPNWLQYQRAMREGKYDIVFDGPHFMGWRIVHLGDHATVKLPGSVDFYILTRAGDNKIHSMDDLIGKDICGIPPPNLGTMTVITQFKNPSRQPVIKGVHGGFFKVYKSFMAGECVAGVVRSNVYNKKLTDEDRAKVNILFKTPPLPNQGITMGKRISDAQRAQFVKWATQPAGEQALAPIVKQFGGKAKAFVAANDAEYTPANALLEGVVFGW